MCKFLESQGFFFFFKLLRVLLIQHEYIFKFNYTSAYVGDTGWASFTGMRPVQLLNGLFILQWAPLVT